MGVKIIKHPGGIYTLYSKEDINTTIERAWGFFSQPKNLNTLTPSDLEFKINSGGSSEVYQGKIITYTIKLLAVLRFNWTTEITKVDKYLCFIDKQLFGPYKLWHHEHYFKDNNDGTITIIDKVRYKLFLHPISKIIHKLFIRKKLIQIFNYRNKMTHEILS
ncbi:MAG: hypothetical protein CMD28_05770 [Flavobacteriales bacterium]|nr:hypothetical protein [Flavobacteriales bacterium]|tara:strand:- start:1617 stop:2102 length:486 start_codon:yes stop_codon:yes gene_type:complete